MKAYISPTIKLATSLSGGLDSSSITAVAQSLSDKPVTAFHIRLNSPFAQERKYALGIVEKWKPAFIETPPPTADYDHIKTMIVATGTLPWGVLPDVCSLYFKEPARHHCDVLLMGEGGDQVLGIHHDVYFDELYDKQDWAGLKAAFRVYEKQRLKASSETPAVEAKNFQLSFLASRFLYGKIKTAASFIEQIRTGILLFTYFEGYRQNIFRWAWQKITRKKIVYNGNVIGFSLFRNDITTTEPAPPLLALNEQLDAQQLCEHPLSTSRRSHINGCYHETLANRLEEMNFLARRVVGIKVDFPFLDREILELCLTVPNTLRFDNGLGRGLLRQSMEKYLSPEIRNRGWKAHFSDYSLECFHILWKSFRQEPHLTTHKVWKIVDKAQFDELVNLIESGNSGNGHRWQAIRVIYLAIWLDYLEQNFNQVLIPE